jgi:hypothetical protein
MVILAFLSDPSVVAVIRSIRRREFTVLDFGDALKRRDPALWQ